MKIKIKKINKVPVVSTNMANTVSCSEKHKSSLVYCPSANKDPTRSYINALQNVT